MNEKLVTIIVLAYNDADDLEESLNSILAQTYRNMEVIVIDNASEDATYETILSFQPAFKRSGIYYSVDYPKRRLTDHNAKIMGMNHEEGDYVYVMSPQCVLREDFIERIVKEFEDDSVGVVALSSLKQGAVSGKEFQEALFADPSDLRIGEAAYRRRDMLVANRNCYVFEDFQETYDAFLTAFESNAVFLEKGYMRRKEKKERLTNQELLFFIEQYTLMIAWVQKCIAFDRRMEEDVFEGACRRLGERIVEACAQAMAEDKSLARRYLHLALAIDPTLEDDPKLLKIKERL